MINACTRIIGLDLCIVITWDSGDPGSGHGRGISGRHDGPGFDGKAGYRDGSGLDVLDRCCDDRDPGGLPRFRGGPGFGGPAVGGILGFSATFFSRDCQFLFNFTHCRYLLLSLPGKKFLLTERRGSSGLLFFAGVASGFSSLSRLRLPVDGPASAILKLR